MMFELDIDEEGDVAAEDEQEETILVLYRVLILRVVPFGINPVLFKYLDGVLARINLDCMSDSPPDDAIDEGDVLVQSAPIR